MKGCGTVLVYSFFYYYLSAEFNVHVFEYLFVLCIFKKNFSQKYASLLLIPN